MHTGALVALLLMLPTMAHGDACALEELVGTGDLSGHRVYVARTGALETIIVRQGLKANADGARRAYQLEGHGTDYLCNGLFVRKGDGWSNERGCRAQALETIAQGEERDGWIHFEGGTPLCVFGFHVEGVEGRCGAGSVVGGTLNGEAMGGKAPLVSLDAPGGPLRHFVSTTSIADKQVDLRSRYIDSETIPFVVRPRAWGSSFPTARFSLRDYAYVHVKTATGKRGETIRGPRGSYALVADTGPAKEFGEGSIALHQLLVYGELRPPPPYELSSGAHPRSDEIFHPYADRGDGDIRAIGNLLEVYYLVFPGSEGDVDEHTFAVGESDERSNVVMHGERAATARGGIDRLIACLDEVETF